MLFKKYPIKLKRRGKKNTKSYRIFYTDMSNNYISPWHNIELINPATKNYNMICEIPKWTRQKMEINTKEKYNPIYQDLKNGELRKYLWGDMLFNYGAFPKTWENPNVMSEETLRFGDDDPLDVIDIGVYQAQIGDVYEVKPLCILALIDNNETDWKVIAINVCDPDAEKINTIADIRKYKKGALDSIKNWFENYKTVYGNRKNDFAFEGKYQNKTYTLKIINECHKLWETI